ncbi:MAG: DUF2264 domain-containing protein [Magnetospirillum sp.]|nr:DUF2264 domain-containing protein [Magnetospirillum sp.]
MAFVPQQLDFERSPFTGLTREHWIMSAEGLLKGVLAHVKCADDPIVFPKRSAVTYPQPGAAWQVLRAEELEGLARTLLVAAPLIEENPALTIHGIAVRDYYARQILAACDPASPRFMGKADAVERANGGRPAQQLVEVAALCIGLMSARCSIWERYSEDERALIATCVRDYAEGKTHPHNWRFFNVLAGAFLQVHGYAVDEALIDGHLHALMSFYAGDGWYRDGIEFDYYSAWAFQFYGPLWCEWIGYRTRPELARLIERRHGELMAGYPQFFGREGKSLLWGRSAAYRCAASAPLVTAFCLRETPMDPGWARRIASGNLLQFLGRDDLWVDGIPSLGFYGPHDAVIQGYSCAASPFWLAKIYQALSLPADSPFWTAVENEGVWSELGNDARTVSLAGPGLTATLHGATGAAECRPGKVVLGQSWYQRLVFNTAFPWEADDASGATAMSYALCRIGRGATGAGKFVAPATMRYAGMRDGVLYRQLVFRSESPMPDVVVDLADIIIPGGVVRVDRLRAEGAYALRLGHFGLPHASDVVLTVATWQEEERAFATARAGARVVLLGSYRGWDRLVAGEHTGKNVEAATSTVLHAVRDRERMAPEVDWLVTLMLHRTDGGEWSRAEVDPVARIESGGHAVLGVHFKNGDVRTVDFSEIEGRLGT